MSASHISDATLATIQALRDRVASIPETASVESGATDFVDALVGQFSTIVLARVFLVTDAKSLPASERAFATAIGKAAPPIADGTSVMTLLATRGALPAWNARAQSRGHLAIPLVDREFVDGAPMIAQLLASLGVELQGAPGAGTVSTRQLAGGRNARFYVEDARTAVNGRGEHIIADRAFVEQHGVRTVFGMGGAYVGGRLAIALVFTTEVLPVHKVDLFPSLIANFKMATSRAMDDGRVFANAS